MAKRSSGSFEAVEKRNAQLVAEQSGLMVLLSGLALAFFLGFLVRGLTNEEMIKNKVMAVVKNHGPDEKIELERAWVRLSNGAWPDFSLVLSQVHIESSNVCALGPSMEINEIRFPLSLWGLIQGGIVFDTAQIDQAVLLLRNDPKDCKQEHEKSHESDREPNSVNLKEVPESSKGTAQVAASESPTAENPVPIPLRRIEIQKIRVNYLPIPFSTFEFQELTAELESLKPLHFDIKSNLDLNGETLSGDYSSHASWKFRYDEAQTIRGRLDLSGTWREGRYDLKGEFEGPSKNYNLSMDLQHIPLSQIFPVLKKYKIMIADFNGKQSWISAEIKSSGKWDHMAKAPWDVDQFSLEGDLGEMRTAAIHFSMLEPVSFEPVEFELKNLDFDRLMDFVGRTHPNPALGHLGKFNGKVLFKNPQEASLQGVHEGLEFVFSNKGSRQIQAIKSFRTELDFKDQYWGGKLSEFELPQGELIGAVVLEADKDWKDLDLNVEFKKLRFSPAIEQLMTQGGSLKDFSGKVKANLQNGTLASLAGNVEGGEWLIEGLRFVNPKIRLGQNGERFTVQAQIAEVVIPPKVAGVDALKKLKEEISAVTDISSDSMGFKNVSASIETLALKDFRWTDVRAQSEKFKFQSRGGWDQENQLFGEIKVTDKRKTHKWKLQGSRDVPQFLKN